MSCSLCSIELVEVATGVIIGCDIHFSCPCLIRARIAGRMIRKCGSAPSTCVERGGGASKRPLCVFAAPVVLRNAAVPSTPASGVPCGQGRRHLGFMMAPFAVATPIGSRPGATGNGALVYIQLRHWRNQRHVPRWSWASSARIQSTNALLVYYLQLHGRVSVGPTTSPGCSG